MMAKGITEGSPGRSLKVELRSARRECHGRITGQQEKWQGRMESGPEGRRCGE
jgi:hypothetical protein